VPDCSLIYKVFIDLDSDNFKGYTPELKQRAKDLFASRLYICAYLYGIHIFATAKDIMDLYLSDSTTYDVKLFLTDGVNDNFKADSDCNAADYGLHADRQDLWLKYTADEGWFSDTHLNLSADGDNRWSYMHDLNPECIDTKLVNEVVLDDYLVSYLVSLKKFTSDTYDHNIMDKEDIILTRIFPSFSDSSDTIVVVDNGVLDLKYNRVFTANSDVSVLSYIL
jgi:hypothetical protein